MAVSTYLKLRGEWVETGTDTGIRVPLANHVKEYILNLATGTGANQADLIWSDTRSLAITTEDLNLDATLTDSFGTAITWAEITGMLFIVNTTTSGVYIKVGGKGATAFFTWAKTNADFVKVGPGGCFLLTSPVDGYAVTTSTADILQIESVGTASYTVVLWGRSA